MHEAEIVDILTELKKISSNNNGWRENKKYVTKELERIDDTLNYLRETLTQMREDLSSLKTELRIKSGIWGLVGGMLPTAITIIILVIRFFVIQ